MSGFKLRNFLRRRWAGVSLVGAIGLLASAVSLYKDGPSVALDLLAKWQGAPIQKEAAKPPAPVAKQPDKRIVTGALPPPRPSLPCLNEAYEILQMLWREGRDIERNFENNMKGGNACITLTVTNVGSFRLEFATSLADAPALPTVYAEPLSSSDLKKFAQGDRVKIEGRFARFAPRTDRAPAKIYIGEARLTKVE